MNGDKKFKEIYDKFNGNYGDLIIDYIRIIKELEKCRNKLRQNKIKK